MSIPSRVEAARILRELGASERLVAHSSTVAEIASFLAGAIEQRGSDIDVGLAEVAALLHDLDKALPADHPLKPLGHGWAGAQWLRDNGYAELAPAVEHHPVMRLADDAHYAAWSSGASIEARVLAYADKRAHQDVVALDDRFARWAARHEGSVELERARGRAELLEAQVCGLAGVEPAAVQRQPWVATALEQAA